MTERVEQLLRAGNEASARVRNLWITFLLFGTYLAIAIGGTTHRQMLLEAPLILPVLNAGLPLVDFYRIAPGLFLVFHFYMLVQLYLLSSKLRAFDEALVYPPVTKGAEADLRLRADNFLVTQMLVGRQKVWLVRLFVWLTAWLTMAAAPIVLFLAFQIRFLPYHDVTTTWIHRLCLIADVLLLWLIWPAISSREGRLGGSLRALFWEKPKALFGIYNRHDDEAQEAKKAGYFWRSLRISVVGHLLFQRAGFGLFGSLIGAAVITVASVGVISFSIFVATIPAEEVERWVLNHPLKVVIDGKEVEEEWRLASPEFAALKAAEDAPPLDLTLLDRAAWTHKRPRARPVPVASEPNHVWWPTAILFEGEPDQASSKVTSLFSRNLVLIDDIDLVTLNDEELEKVDRTLVLRGRDLRYARFDRTDLRKADLLQAKLTGATLQKALLVEANIQSADLQGADLRWAEMAGAYLVRANLAEANLRETKLQGADLRYAKLNGAEMLHTNLMAADLRRADIAGAKLSGPNLAGTDLRQVNDPQRLLRQAVNSRPTSAWTRKMQQAFGEELGRVGCELDPAPYIARGLFRRVSSESDSEIGGRRYYHTVVSLKLLADDCLGSKELTAEEKAKLRIVSKRVP